MATLESRLLGEGIIWEGLNVTAYRKRGSMVIESVQREPGAWGFVGSDRVMENSYGGFRETLEPVVNDKGQPLRFGLIAYNALRARAKLVGGDRLTIATSYPQIASSLLKNTENIVYVPGCVEAELRDREKDVDMGFELIQSGDTVRDNDLEVIEDNIMQITLECLRTPYDW